MSHMETIKIDVSATALREKFDAYWNLVKDSLSQEVIAKATKGGFRNVTKNRVVKAAGGEHIFYGNQIVNEIKDWCTKNEKCVMAFDNATIKYTSAEVTTLSADIYYEPDVKWLTNEIPGVKSTLEIEIDAKQSRDDLIGSVIHNEVMALLDKHATTTQSSTPIAIGSIAVLDVESKIDGVINADRTGTNVMWLVSPDQFKEPQIADNLVGLSINDTKEFDITFCNTPELNGKVVSIKVKINNVLNRELPTFDVVAKTFNKTADELMAVIRDAVTKQVDSARNEAILAKFTGKLTSLCEVSCTPPDGWVASRASIIFNQNVHKLGSEENVLKAFTDIMPMSSTLVSKDDAIKYIAHQILSSYNTDIILKAWGLKAGVKLDDNRFVQADRLAEYADLVRTHILSSAKIKENIL